MTRKVSASQTYEAAWAKAFAMGHHTQGRDALFENSFIMLSSAIVKIVDFCARYHWRVFILGILLLAAAVTYDVARFSVPRPGLGFSRRACTSGDAIDGSAAWVR